MNRFDRVSAIMIILQTKRFVTAEEMAQRFEVSKRTIYRDLNTLEAAGIPLSAEAGKGYYLVDGYHLPPVMFTPDEAAALLLAGKMMEKLSDISARQSFKMAFDKIRAVLPGKDKLMVETLNNSIEVYHVPEATQKGCDNRYLTTIQKALANHHLINIGYYTFSRDETIESRLIEPIGLCFYSLHWHLIAWCRVRHDYRDFRIDRIISLTETHNSFEPRKIKSLQAYFAAMKQKQELYEAKVMVDIKTAHIMENSRYYYGFLESEPSENGIICHFVTSDYNYLARWLLMFADGLIDVAPTELATEIRRLKTMCKI